MSDPRDKSLSEAMDDLGAAATELGIAVVNIFEPYVNKLAKWLDKKVK